MEVAKTSCKQWSAWDHPAHYGVFDAVTPGIGGLPWMRKWKRKRNGNGINTKRKRNERTQYEPKTDPKCNQNGAQMYQTPIQNATKTQEKTIRFEGRKKHIFRISFLLDLS